MAGSVTSGSQIPAANPPIVEDDDIMQKDSQWVLSDEGGANPGLSNPFRRPAGVVSVPLIAQVGEVPKTDMLKLIDVESSELSLVPTARFCLRINGHVYESARGICDTGSQVNLISARCAQRLGLPLARCNIAIGGIGGNALSTSGSICAELCDRTGNSIGIVSNWLVVPEIASVLPERRIVSDIGKAIGIGKLADPGFACPARIEALLGAGLVSQIFTSARRMRRRHDWDG